MRQPRNSFTWKSNLASGIYQNSSKLFVKLNKTLSEVKRRIYYIKARILQ